MPWNIANWSTTTARWRSQARITGSFTGTTDEVLQWTACKWGFDEDHVRAEAFEQRSGPRPCTATGTDAPTSKCPPDADTRPVNGALECAQTYGMLQVVWQYHKSAWPMFRDSTPFHLDFVYALRRVCFEGWDTRPGRPLANPHALRQGRDGAAWAPTSAAVGTTPGRRTTFDDVQGQLAGRGWETLKLSI